MKKIFLFLLICGIFISCNQNPGGGSTSNDCTFSIQSPTGNHLQCNGWVFTQKFKYTITVYTYNSNLQPVVYDRKRTSYSNKYEEDIDVKVPNKGQYFIDFICESELCETVPLSECSNGCGRIFYFFSSEVNEVPINRYSVSFNNWKIDSYECCN